MSRSSAATDFYLRELAKIMRDDGMVYSTWFFSARSDSPMMEDFIVCLHIKEIKRIDSTNRIIYDPA